MLQETLLYIFYAALGIQIIYLLLFLAGIFKKTKKASEPVPVSIVIAARNEFENLKILLPKLISQQYHNFEIIVVDDRSDDDTMLLEKDSAYSNVRFIRIDNTPQHIQSKKYAITIGIKQAKNPIILLTDADCFPATDLWVQQMAASYSGQKSIVLGFSGYTTKKSFLNYFIRFETLMTGIQYIGLAGLGMPYMGVGRNLSYKKDFFHEKKGFKKYQAVVGGDDDLFVNQHAKGSNTTYAIGQDALVLSNPKESWSSYFHQKVRHLSVGKLYKKRNKALLSLFSLSQITCWILFILLLLMAPGELYFIGTGFLIRIVLLILLFALASRRIGQPFNVAGVLLMDFCYTIYYIFVGTAALFARKIRWS